MAAVSSAVCLRLLLVAVAVLASVPASSQQQPITTRVITDPGFRECLLESLAVVTERLQCEKLLGLVYRRFNSPTND